MKLNHILYLLTFMLSFFSYASYAQQRLDMEGTAIIGNKELPKILYIVPWKTAEDITLNTPPFSSVLDKAFQPVERSTFNRQINFYNDLYSVPFTKPETN